MLVDSASFKEPPAEYRNHRWIALRLSAAQSDSYGNSMLAPDGGTHHGALGCLLKGSHRPPGSTVWPS